jgi:hypothetical protein
MLPIPCPYPSLPFPTLSSIAPVNSPLPAESGIIPLRKRPTASHTSSFDTKLGHTALLRYCHRLYLLILLYRHCCCCCYCCCWPSSCSHSTSTRSSLNLCVSVPEPASREGTTSSSMSHSAVCTGGASGGAGAPGGDGPGGAGGEPPVVACAASGGVAVDGGGGGGGGGGAASSGMLLLFAGPSQPQYVGS